MRTPIRPGNKVGGPLAVIVLTVALLSTEAQETAAAQPKKVIYETDMCLDVDDAGGLAMLHALADKGEVEILAVTFNEVHPSGAAAIDAINTWYGQKEHPADYQRAASKAVLYNTWYQDDAGNYIETHHPEVTRIYCGHFAGTWNYRSQPNMHDFITENVKTGHGPLGALYPQTYISEGDSPAFFYTMDNGLRNHEHPGFGGWGGRFKNVEGFARVYIDAEDEGGKKYQLARWIEVVNQDFKARMDWCVKEFKDANHAPVARVKGKLNRDVKAGDTVNLAAIATDLDGNKLTYKWWQYADAGSATATMTIANSDSLDQASFVAPNEPGKQVHIILEVTDNGTPPLLGYQRVISNIK